MTRARSKFTRLLHRAAAAALCTVLASEAAWAQAETFPNRAIRVVTQVPPGSGFDAILRAMAPALQANLGQPVVIENRPGAEGIIAAEMVARSAADGYTLLAATQSQLTTNPIMYERLPYAVERDFAPVTLLTENFLVLIANPKLGAASIAGLRDASRKRADAFSMGTSSVVFAAPAVQLSRLTGIALRQVPFSSISAAVVAVMGEHLDIAFVDAGSAVEAARGGRVAALGVAGNDRIDSLPGAQTFVEQGLPELDQRGWTALVAPANVPPAIIDRLRVATARALSDPAVVARLANVAARPTPSAPAKVWEIARRDRAAFQIVAQELGLAKAAVPAGSSPPN